MISYRNKKTGTVVIPGSELGAEAFKNSAAWEPVKPTKPSKKAQKLQAPAAEPQAPAAEVQEQEETEQEG